MLLLREMFFSCNVKQDCPPLLLLCSIFPTILINKMSLPTFTYVLSSPTGTRILSNFFSGIASACTTIWQVVGAQYPLDAHIPLNADLCPLQHSGKRNHRSDSILVTHTLVPCLIRWIRLSTILTSSPRVRNGKQSQVWTKTVCWWVGFA